MKRAKKKTKKLKTYLGRIYREVERHLEKRKECAPFRKLLGRIKKLLSQGKISKNKLYSLHAPEVECIGKGKAHKRYGCGVKVSVRSTIKIILLLEKRVYREIFMMDIL